MKFTVTHTDGTARRGKLLLPHGEVDTPQFMPVGTAASVKAIAPDDLHRIGAQIVLANTYHLLLRPGPALVAEIALFTLFAYALLRSEALLGRILSGVIAGSALALTVALMLARRSFK